jgi:hypothetical protein
MQRRKKYVTISTTLYRSPMLSIMTEKEEEEEEEEERPSATSSCMQAEKKRQIA